MKSFFADDVLLTNESAKRVYQAVKDLPIIDYHCHLDQYKIADDYEFENIGEIWLAGDHYKWRAMRLCGVDEELITGKASWKDKFVAYATIFPKLIGNPLYYWTQLELKQVFGINKPLNKDTALEIYEEANKFIKKEHLSVRKVLKRFNLEFIATTDDPVDTLEKHGSYEGIEIRPTFRPDKLYTLDEEYLQKLGKVAGFDVSTLSGLKNALINRLDYFVSKGCRISDHAFLDFPIKIADEKEAEKLYSKRDKLTPEEKDMFLGWLVKFLMKEYKKRDIIVQLHFAVVRNVNSPAKAKIGVDSGYDVMSEEATLSLVTQLLDSLPDEERPTIVLYTLNPTTIPALATLTGAFRNVLIGAAWWFNDALLGIRHNLEHVSEYAALGTNLGMLTDSRSFTSYVRFDFFRRILSTFIGERVERGEYDENEAVKLATDICYNNIKSLLMKGK